MTEQTLPQDDLEYNGWTTLAEIREHGPCSDGWEKLLTNLGKTKADNEPLHIATVLESNGFDDALWCLHAKSLDRLSRHFQAWCADQVLHIFEAERPDDVRVREQIDTLRNDGATPERRAAARVAARAAARDAARAAARDAARAAARDEARAAAWAAARDEARAAAWAAARDEARAAAWAAARDEAWAADWAAQDRQFRAMISMKKVSAMNDDAPDATQAGKWTPGPWEKCHDHPDPDTARSLAHIRGPRGEWGDRVEVATVYGCNGVYDGDMTQEANARLIAAAPDMLEALREIDAWSRRANIALPSPLIYTAIAKATGNAQ